MARQANSDEEGTSLIGIEEAKNGDGVGLRLEWSSLERVFRLERKGQVGRKVFVVSEEPLVIGFWQWIVAGQAQDRPDSVALIIHRQRFGHDACRLLGHWPLAWPAQSGPQRTKT